MASAATVAVLAWIIFEITRQAAPSIQKFGLDFLTNSKWVPNRNIYGVSPFLIGTVVSSLIALIFALPLGLAIAIFLSEDFLPLPIRQVVRFTVEMLAAIPSVVYGLWGIFVVIPLVQGFGAWAVVAFKNIPVLNTIFAPPAYGNSMLTASLVLALTILPTITAISRSALVAVPGTLREGAYALGLDAVGGDLWRHPSHSRARHRRRYHSRVGTSDGGKPWPSQCLSATVRG